MCGRLLLRLLGLAGLGMAAAAVALADGAQGAVDAPQQAEPAPELDPMDLDGVDPQLSYVLSRYYQNALGGREHWQQVQSVRFEGSLQLAQGSFSFVAFKKKPEFCKVVLFAPNGERVVMAYDGQDAWQLNSVTAPVPAAMPPLEALNFIRDASVGGHLLYPTAPHKQIELLGTQRVGDEACSEVRVTLANGQQVTYSIGMTSFTERRQTVVNAVSGEVEVTTHAQTQEVDGLLVPMQSTMTVNGAFRHAVALDRVSVNVGVMPWMFARPAGAYIPGSVPPPVAPLAEQSAGLPSAAAELPGAASSAFNLDANGGPAAASRFEGLDDATKQSILQELEPK